MTTAAESFTPQPEICPRCGGWLFRCPEPCRCAIDPQRRVAVAARRIGRVLDELDGDYRAVAQELWDALWQAVDQLPEGF